MKKVYKVFEGTDKSGNTYYYGAFYKTPFCPIFGSIGTKAQAKKACADRLCITVREYNSLQNAI